MATLRMPDSLARELISHCIGTLAPTRVSDELLRLMISAFGELAVRSAHIVAADDASRRHAEVIVDVEDAAALRTLFPGAPAVQTSPSGRFLFRLRRPHQFPENAPPGDSTTTTW
jgi:hypothetical protein